MVGDLDCKTQSFHPARMSPRMTSAIQSGLQDVVIPHPSPRDGAMLKLWRDERNGIWEAVEGQTSNPP